MYHYDPRLALDELRDDAVLPHPVHLRDMILRTKLDANSALDLNREFQEYLSQFGEAQRTARGILERLSEGVRKASAGDRRVARNAGYSPDAAESVIGPVRGQELQTGARCRQFQSCWTSGRY